MNLTCYSDWEIKNAYRILVVTLHWESQDSMVIVATKLYVRQHGIGLEWPVGNIFFSAASRLTVGPIHQYVVMSWVQLFTFSPFPVSTLFLYGAVVHVSTTCWFLIGKVNSITF